MGVDVNLCCGNDFAFVVETAKPLTPMILYVFSVKLDFAFTDLHLCYYCYDSCVDSVKYWGGNSKSLPEDLLASTLWWTNFCSIHLLSMMIIPDQISNLPGWLLTFNKRMRVPFIVRYNFWSKFSFLLGDQQIHPVHVRFKDGTQYCWDLERPCSSSSSMSGLYCFFLIESSMIITIIVIIAIITVTPYPH